MTAFAAKTAEHDSAKSRQAKSQSDHLPDVQSAPIFDFQIQRKTACACGGDCPNCQDDSIIQTKLTVGEPNDQYEQEADLIAAHVMRMPRAESVEAMPIGEPYLQLKPLSISPVGFSQISRLQRQTEEDESEEIVQTKRIDSANEIPEAIQTKKEVSLSRLSLATNSLQNIQRQSLSESENEEEIEEIPNEKNFDYVQTKAIEADEISPAEDETVALKTATNTPKTQNIGIEDILGRKRGGGTSLPEHSRNFMENRFGVDFGGVRIHQDNESNKLNRQLNSLAFTTGQDIYFSSGMYRPGTSEGDQLLAHELTHVVQQTGGTHLQRKINKNGFYIQRYGGDENKWYTRDVGVVPGSVAHRTIEKILEASDTSLLTEAPIPGATSDDRALNLVGFADLYKSDGNIVSGVHGFYSKDDEGAEPARKEEDYNKQIASGVKLKTLNYKNMPTPKTSKVPGSKWSSLSPDKRYKHGPKLKDKVKGATTREWDTTADFPASFQVGEIKPLSAFKVKAGSFQLGNYIKGFTKFVAETYINSGKKTRATTSGAELDLTLPKEIDYAQFDTEHASTSVKQSLLVKSGKVEKRIWIYKLPDPKGLYVYFSITHPYAPADYPEEIERVLTTLDPLLIELREKHPKIPGKIAPKRVDKPADKPEKKAEKQKISRKSSAKIIQRAPDKNYWAKRGNEWEKKHKTWDKGEKGADKFLESTARGPLERQKIEAALDIPPGKGRKVADEAKKLKKIKLWSGKTGAGLGKLRFYFGTLFDRLMTFFEKVKTKFEKWFKDSDKIKPKGKLAVGWVSTATKVILKFAVEIFKEVLQRGYAAFSACINGMMDKVIDRFTDELNEKLREELNPVAEKVADLHKKLDDEFVKYAGEINLLVESVDQISQWKDILSGLEIAIRVGVQVVSCGTPPGLGCLWGLVAQLAIGTALELLTETKYFDDYIARPTADKLMKHFVGNAFQNLVASSVDSLGLSKYTEGVAECAKVSDSSGGGSGFFGSPGKAFDPNAPDVVKVRQAWEAKHHDAIMNDLLKVFVHSPTEKGKKPEPMTKEDIEKLLEELKKANLSPEALRAMVEGAKTKGTKKVKIDEFIKELGKVPGEDTRTASADAPEDLNKSQTQQTLPNAQGGKEEDKGKANQGTDASNDNKDTKGGIPLFDANKLGKVGDDAGIRDLPNFFFRVRPSADHEAGKIYDVVIDMFEKQEVFVVPANSEDEDTPVEYRIVPFHIYSVSNVRALVLKKEPNIVKGTRKGFRITYQILENVEIKYQPEFASKPMQHIIPKKKPTAILK